MVEIKVDENDSVKVTFGLGLESLAWITNKEAMIHMEKKHREREAALREAEEREAKVRVALEDMRRRLRDQVPPINVTVVSPEPGQIADRLKEFLGKRIAPEWQTMESAPKDGTSILVYDRQYGEHVAKFVKFCDRWCVALGDSFSNPTHWMPLPEAPR